MQTTRVFHPQVTTGQGTITVQCMGDPNETYQIVVSQNGTQVATHSGQMDGNGNLSDTFQGLHAGTYDVTITAPSPGGTVCDFPGQVVS
jgi:hypothetical protein